VVAVVETVKAATEVTAPRDGVLSAIFARAGDEVAVGAPLGLIGDAPGVGRAVSCDQHSPSPGPPREADRAAAPGDEVPPLREPSPVQARAGGRLVASPFARKLAVAAGLDLTSAKGSGPGGRIKARDVEAALARRPGARGPILSVLRRGTGSDAPILLLHGFAADASTWRPLERHLGRAERILIELPCHGSSPCLAVSTFQGLADLVTETFDALALDRAHLVGHSLGAAAALALAGRRPAQAASLCLIAPAGFGPEINGEAIAGLARASRPESLAPWLRRMVADPALVSNTFVRASLASRGDAEKRAAQAALAEALFPDGVQAFDLTDALPAVAMPTRAIWGRADRILPWRQALAAPGHVGVHLLPGIGHLPHLEAPALVARIIGELVESANAGTRSNPAFPPDRNLHSLLSATA
jgi:pyruvate dehydrogenase E2 component (dihydrolipoamide acetyltransferase)